MELACFLTGGVLAAGLCAFEEAASYVNKVYLPVRILWSPCQGQEHKDGGKEKYFYPCGQTDFIA